jgi:hypothetical protein
MATGLGSPNAANLPASLCGLTLKLANPGPQKSAIGVPVNLAVSATDAPGKAVSYSAGGLPAGLSINPANGLISGTPSATGTSTVTVHAADSDGSSANTAFTWTVDTASVAVVYPGNRSGRVGKPVSLQMVAFTNDGGAVSFSASGLAGGLTIKSTTGLISGTPSSPGKFSVTVTARYGPAASITRFAWSIAGPSVSRASLSGISKGQPRLAFTLSAGKGFPAIRKLQIGLPKGLGFGRSFANGTAVYGPKGKRINGLKLKLSKGVLTITLPKAIARLRITIAPPAIGAGKGLITNVKHKKVRQVLLTLKPTDARGFTSILTPGLKPS